MRLPGLSKYIFSIMLMLMLTPHLFCQKSFVYVFPIDGTDKHNPEQNIILKSNSSINPASLHRATFSLEASFSGPHSFSLLLSPDQKTLLIKPTQSFINGEKILFNYLGGLETNEGRSLNEINISFSIIDHDRSAVWKELEKIESEKSQSDIPLADANPLPEIDNNLPDDYPPVSIINSVDHDNEYFFLNLNSRFDNLGWEKYITIVDSYGTPVFYDQSEYNRINFDILPNGLLYYAINTAPNSQREKYFIMDSTYKIIDSVNTGNGYILDAHDMLLLENGHYLVMSYDPQPIDMSQLVSGGDPEAIVTGLVIQEVDHNENVFFQWRSWDHFEITDATDDINLLAHTIDYVHGNAFEIDMDGHILLSSRHLDEITKIDFNSGEIIWRFGQNSENNMFQIYNDPTGFSHQHDIRIRQNGNYTLYDNGNLNTPPISRALEYTLNETELVAVLNWVYSHPTELFSEFAGGFKVLNNGQRIIGWGGTYPISSTVVDINGNIDQKIYLPDYISSYRVFKYPWTTSIFETEPLLSLGNASNYNEGKINRLYIYNTGAAGIKITSIHHHDTAFKVLSELPLAIFPGHFEYVEIGFDPELGQDYDDRFTLNFDNAQNTRRISRQLKLSGYIDEETPSAFIYPSYGETNVSPDTVLTIQFDEAVTKVFGGEIQNEDIPNLVELKEEHIRGEAVSFSGEINEEKTRISIFPDQVLEEDQTYLMRLLGNKVKSYDGHIVKLAEESYFKTGLMTDLEKFNDEDVRVYPNPTSEDFVVEVDPGQFNVIKMYNLYGQLIMKVNSLSAKNQINMSGLPSGIYFIHLQTQEGNHSHTIKMVKQ